MRHDIKEKTRTNGKERKRPGFFGQGGGKEYEGADCDDQDSDGPGYTAYQKYIDQTEVSGVNRDGMELYF